jgi:hypothetical protein
MTGKDTEQNWISKTWIVPLASRRFWSIHLLELYYLQSLFSISLAGGWRVVRCEIRFGDRYDSFNVSNDSLQLNDRPSSTMTIPHLVN